MQRVFCFGKENIFLVLISMWRYKSFITLSFSFSSLSSFQCMDGRWTYHSLLILRACMWNFVSSCFHRFFKEDDESIMGFQKFMFVSHIGKLYTIIYFFFDDCNCLSSLIILLFNSLEPFIEVLVLFIC